MRFMNDKFAEKRKYPRAPVKVEIICDELKDEDRRGIGVLCFYSSDISIGGIFLETTVPFSVGATLHLKFTLPNVKRDVKTVGKVIRTKEGDANLLVGIGIEFQHLSYEDKKVIEGYVIDEIADQL